MAGRLYIGPITGDGTSENPYRAFICTLPNVVRCRNTIGSIGEGPNRGRPARSWTLAYVEATDYTAIDANNQVFLVRLEENPTALMTNIVQTRIRQTGAMTQSQLDANPTYCQALNFMLKDQYGALARLSNEWPEIDWSGCIALVPDA